MSEATWLIGMGAFFLLGFIIGFAVRSRFAEEAEREHLHQLAEYGKRWSVAHQEHLDEIAKVCDEQGIDPMIFGISRLKYDPKSATYSRAHRAC